MTAGQTRPTLVEFLLARLREDEREARGAIAERVRVSRGGEEPDWRFACWPDLGAPAVVVGGERVLAEVEAKRRIVQYALDIQGGDDEIDWSVVDDLDAPQVQAMAVTLLALTLPYAGHPDYDERWRA